MNTENQTSNSDNKTPESTTPAPVVSTSESNEVKPKVEDVSSSMVETSVASDVTPIIEAVSPVVEAASEEKVETPLIEPVVAPLALSAATPMSATKKNWLAFLAGLLVAFGTWYIYHVVTTAEMTGSTENYPAVVAKVNGEKISGEDFERGLTQTENVALSQGVDTTSAEGRKVLEEQALVVITNTRLLVQTAMEKGFSASDEEVAEQLANIEAQFGSKEALLAEAEKFGISPEGLESDIAEQIAVDKYLRETIAVDNIVIEDAAIEAAYAAVAASSADVPPLESVRSAIEGQLKGEKQQELIAKHLEELRANADIEILI